MCLARRAVGGGRGAGPGVLRAHPGESLDAYPAWQLLAGDALFTRGTLARLITQRGEHHPRAIKGSQPDLLEATPSGSPLLFEDFAILLERGRAGPFAPVVWLLFWLMASAAILAYAPG